MNPNLAVVFDESQIPEAIHEKAHARPGCANHFGQHFLTDLGYHRLRLALLAELREQVIDDRWVKTKPSWAAYRDVPI